MNRSELSKALAEGKVALQAKGVPHLALFGSYARNEQTERSDVDILVEVDAAIGLGFVTLAEELERHLHERVDLLSSRAVKPNRRRLIEADLIYV